MTGFLQLLQLAGAVILFGALLTWFTRYLSSKDRRPSRVVSIIGLTAGVIGITSSLVLVFAR